MIERAIVADLGSFPDDDAHAVVNEKTPSDACPRMNFYARQPAPDVGQKTREPLQAPMPQPVRQAVKQKSVKAGIAGNDLPGRARSRVPIKYDGYLFPSSVEHKTLLLLWVGI